MNKSFQDGVQFAWDATSLTSAMTCPRKYYYDLILGIQPKILSVHLLFGQHYATALERFYKLRAEGSSIEDALDEIVRRCLEETWDEVTGQPVAFSDAAKTRYSLIRSIVWYVEEFGDESDMSIKTVHFSDGRPAVEVSFTLEVTPDVVFCGHLDRIVEDEFRYVMDQKTTKYTMSPQFFDQFKLNNQMSLYTFAGSAILDSPVKGVIIDGAQIAVNFTRFSRGITLRTKAELEEWQRSALHVINMTQHFSSMAQISDVDAFPMNYTACDKYGGCPFKQICSSSPKIRENVIKTFYEPKVWDPLERR